MRDQQTVNSMLCPVCRTGLSLSDRSGIEIDYCPSCRGVWLDRGELDKIIERTEQSTRYSDDKKSDRASAGGLKGKLWAAASAMMDEDRRDHRKSDRSRYDEREYRRKKKPSLSDFFD